jgi:hypothetical protein
MKRKLACFITGAPRGNDYCLSSLRHLLRRFEAEFYIVLREEFDTEALRAYLIGQLGNARFIIVPATETARAVPLHNSSGRLKINLWRMWHEVDYAVSQTDLSGYDYAARTRFDLFFAPMAITPEAIGPAQIVTPEKLSWSGVNDMFAIAPTGEFRKYASVYQSLSAFAEQRITVPEMILACALEEKGCIVRPTPIHIGLYRKELLSELNERQLAAAAFVASAETSYPAGGPGDTHEAQAAVRDVILDAVGKEDRFPLFLATPDIGFHDLETDPRDGTAFRFIDLHAAMNRSLDMVDGMRFTICFWPPGWEMENLTIAIDGRLLHPREVGRDAYGRIIVEALPDKPFQGCAPWSKVGFVSTGAVLAKELNPESTDTRRLSIAITNPVFF